VPCIQQTSTNAALRESLKPFSTDVFCMDCLQLTLVFNILELAGEGLLSDDFSFQDTQVQNQQTQSH
jgi:hypothetical protein